MTKRHVSAGRILFILAMLAMAAMPLSALAETNCSASLSSIDFGTVVPGQDATVNADISYECETAVPAFAASETVVRMCIAIGPGTAPGSTVASRRMASGTPGASPLAFQLYRDAAELQAWGDSPSGAITWHPIQLRYPIQSFIGIGGTGRASGTARIRGRVPAQALLRPGDYLAAFPDARLVFRYTDVWPWPAPGSCQSGGTGGSVFLFSFSAHANVASRCTVQAGPLHFGDVPGLVTRARDQSALVELECTPGTAYQVGLDPGRHAAGGVRRMRHASGGEHVAYALYRDPARTLPWGATPDVDTVAGTGTGAAQRLTVHGRIPAGQVAPAGSYSDVVTVTVSY